MPKPKSNDSDLYDAAIEPSEQHGTSTASKTDSPPAARQTNNSGTTPTTQPSNPSQARNLPALGSSANSSGRRYCCYIGEFSKPSDIWKDTFFLAIYI